MRLLTRPGWFEVSPDSDPGGFVVQETSLDEFVLGEGHPRPDLLKIDVVGAEGPVLREARRILREHRPAVVCEIHGSHSGAEVHEELRAAGSGLWTLDLRPMTEIPRGGHVVGIPEGRRPT